MLNNLYNKKVIRNVFLEVCYYSKEPGGYFLLPRAAKKQKFLL